MIIKKLGIHLLLLCSLLSNVTASHVDTLLVTSASMNKTIQNIVILPDEYSDQSRVFPVLFLLHEAFGDFRDWVTKVPEIKAYADQYNMIVVCPDGGFNSWYFDSPIDKQMQYETYLAKELIASVDQTYRTSPQKSARAITGLSMGGHGAFYLAFKHQNIWGAAGSMSGGMDLRPFPDNWDIKKRLGEYSNYPENWEENTVINMIYLLNGESPKLIFDCGTDDFFYDSNQRLHEKLIERNIPHDYITRPGNHNWEYWANAITFQFLYFDNFFDSNNS